MAKNTKESVPFDILIVGGGINGVGIARDAAGRGLKILLCEQRDLASGTSSASTKLIHGGLRYLENYEFRLVRESLLERDVLRAAAPHLITPVRFILPHHRRLRPAFLLRLGLWLYDILASGTRLPKSRAINLRKDPRGHPLKDSFRRGFEYSDCWADDARLVVLNAMAARESGATVLTQSECVDFQRHAAHWDVTVESAEGERTSYKARAMVNAAGPWAGSLYQKALNTASARHSIRLVKGSHIVIGKRLCDQDSYILQHDDGRVTFVIPYQDDLTLIGTTDMAFNGDPADAVVSADEIEYLCASVANYFREPVTPADVVWSYTGVRPLYEDGKDSASKVSRDYVLDLESTNGAAPLLSVFGGKLTTFRKLSERAVTMLSSALDTTTQPWTASATLPGGAFADGTPDSLLAPLGHRFPWLESSTVSRLVAAYGSRAIAVLGTARSVEDLGQHFGMGLYESEVEYLATHEWATCAADILWRRSKLGLHTGAATTAKLERWFRSHSECAEEPRPDNRNVTPSAEFKYLRTEA